MLHRKRSQNSCEGNTKDEDVRSQRRYKELTANLSEDENKKCESRKNYIIFLIMCKHIIDDDVSQKRRRTKKEELAKRDALIMINKTVA